MRLRFRKMTGAGNDFVVLAAPTTVEPSAAEIRVEDLPRLARLLCPRRRAIGADGLLYLEPGTRADCRVHYYNADGSEAGMCGNGARCAARRAVELGLGANDLTLDFGGSLHHAWVGKERVRVSLGEPRAPRRGLRLEVDGRELVAHALDTGVPHLVVPVPEIEAVAVARLGPLLRHHPSFAPGGTNVDFVEFQAEGPIPLRTYERGVEAETLACGTGAAAAALIVHWELGRRSPIELRTRGGEILTVHFREREGAVEEVFLEGEAREVFAGEIEVSLDVAGAAGESGAASSPAPGRQEKGVAAR